MIAYRPTALAFAIVSPFLLPAFAGAARASAPPVPLDAPRFVRAGDLETDVTIRWTMRPSKSRGEADPGPYVGDGLVAIVSGPSRTNTIVTLASLHVTPPNAEQIVPTGTPDCGSNGPIAIVPLAGATAPAVIVTTIAIGKGCLPIPHALLPLDARSRRFVAVPVYGLTSSLPAANPGTPATVRTLRVVRARPLALPMPPPGSPFPRRHMTVIEARDSANRTVEVVLDSGPAATGSLAGSVVRIEDQPNGFEGAAAVRR